MEPPKLTPGEYCEKLFEWAYIMRKRYAELAASEGDDLRKPWPQGQDFISHLDQVILAITKSSLLRRTLYGGEKPRTKPCPLHKGVWSGCYPYRPDMTDWGRPEPCECWDGFEASGWIPEKEE